MDINELDKGVKDLSESDKASLASEQKEVDEAKAKMGVVDEPENSNPEKKVEEAGVVLGPEEEPAPKPDSEKKEEKVEPAPADPTKDLKDKKEPETPERPIKYIPIPKYQEEKKEWEKQLSSKDEAILNLQKELDAAKAAGKPDETKAKIDALADKMGIESEHVQEVIAMAREGFVPAPAAKVEEPVKKEEPAPAAPVDPFPQEWDAALPELRKQFPNATAEQLADAKEEFDKLSHTDTYRRYPLDYAFTKEAETLKTLLSNPRRRSIEPGAHGKADYVPPADQGKPDFDNMTPQKAKEIERQRAEAAEAEQPGIRIMRNGKEERV